MSTITVDLGYPQISLPDLLSEISAGTEIVFVRDETPVARVMPLESQTPKKRQADLHPGAFVISEDFDEELPDSFWLGEE